jgi:hypothetical protein
MSLNKCVRRALNQFLFRIAISYLTDYLWDCITTDYSDSPIFLGTYFSIDPSLLRFSSYELEFESSLQSVTYLFTVDSTSRPRFPARILFAGIEQHKKVDTT